jgi:antitoxin (DNA-binding transcriptional repressor) of toxin-antitoxin stability system
METTLDYAAAHFLQLLGRVAEGEEIVLRNGTVPVARIVPIPQPRGARAKVREITSEPVRWTEESFAALDGVGMKQLGLL